MNSEQRAIADAATAANPQCRDTYCQALEAAEKRHVTRVNDARFAYAMALNEAGAVYSRALPDDVKAGETYRAASVAAEKALREEIEASGQTFARERDGAEQADRASPGWLGWV